MKKIGIGLLGLGTVGQGVASIISDPIDRNPLVRELEILGVAVRNLQKKREISIPESILTTNPIEIINNPDIRMYVLICTRLLVLWNIILSIIQSLIPQTVLNSG